jgi:hypothetical protein
MELPVSRPSGSRVLLTSLIVLVHGSIFISEPAGAQIALHAVPAPAGPVDCQNAPTSFGCGWRTSGLNTSANLNEITDVYIVAVPTDTERGFSAAAFSLDYNGPTAGGLQVLDWESCGDQTVTDSGWPAPGGRIEIRFDENNCQGTEPDTALFSSGGFAVLAVLRVIASGLDTLQVAAYEEDNLLYAGCGEALAPMFVNMLSAGEIGFGVPWYWDPCNSPYTYDHICWVFPGSQCSCCMPNDTCRNITWYFDNRNCRDAGGTPLESAGCDDCAVPVVPTTWGGLKATHR